MARGKERRSHKAEIKTARQLIRHRNIMLGLPIRYLDTAFIPYGYELDPDKEGWLRPVEKELQILYLARTSWAHSSLEKLAVWISNETGRPLTWQGLRSIFRTRLPLATYLLPLHDRISIATALNEDKAIEIQPEGRRWDTRNNPNRAKYYEARRAAVAKREQERRDLKRQKDNIPAE